MKNDDDYFCDATKISVGEGAEKNNKCIGEILDILSKYDYSISQSLAILIGAVHMVVLNAENELKAFSCGIGRHVFTMELDSEKAETLRDKTDDLIKEKEKITKH